MKSPIDGPIAELSPIPIPDKCDSILRPDGALQLLFDTIKDFAIIIVNLEGMITSWNSGVERIFGYNENQFVGQPFSMIFVPEDRSAGVPQKELTSALTTGIAIDERWHLKKNNARFYASGTVRPIIQNGETTGFIKVIQDLTKEQLEKEALKRANSEAERAKSATTYFISSASHELRSPLTAILAAVEVIEAQGIEQKNHEFLAIIKRSALVEARMVDDLFDATKLNHAKLSMRMESISAHGAIAEVVNDMKQDATDKNIQILLHPDAKEQSLRADPTRFRQVIRNLLSNAIKFTSSGGTVTLSTTDAENKTIRITVEDSGMGMSKETIGKLFQPFEQGTHDVNHRFGGLGLGLVITKGLVEQHGGSIDVESKGPGLGSTFTVSWPLEVKTAQKEEIRTESTVMAS